MKYTLGILASLAMVATSQAVSLTVALDPSGGDVAGGTARAIFDNSGAGLLGGYVGYGTFPTAFNPATDNGAALEAKFSVFGTTGLVSGRDIGGGNIAAGTFAFGTSQAVGAGNPLATQNIWVVIGNAATLAASTQALIIDTGVQFGDDDPTPGIVSVDLQAFGGTPIFGSSSFAGGQFVLGVGTFPAASNSYQLRPLVPEPSSSLLFGFAGLALLIRRKR
jgi:hypothetical protein